MNTVSLFFKQSSRTLKQLYKEQSKVVAVIFAVMPAAIFLLPYLLQMISREDIPLLIRAVVFSIFTLGAAQLISKLHDLAYGSGTVMLLSQLTTRKYLTRLAILSVDLVILFPLHLLLSLAYFYVTFETELPTNNNAFTVFLLSFYCLIIVSCIQPKLLTAAWLIALITYSVVHGFIDVTSLLVMMTTFVLFALKTWLIRYILKYQANVFWLIAYVFRKPIFLFQMTSLAFVYLISSVIESLVVSAVLFLILFNFSTLLVTGCDRSNENKAPYLNALVKNKQALLSNLALIVFLTGLLPATIFLVADYFSHIIFGALLLSSITLVLLLPQKFINFKHQHALILANVLVSGPLLFEILAQR